ncbi:MAG: molybdenum cofactor guanylyltransferase [Thermodesulfobacteriota bacterium]|nr:molybdenum cofactor guanylyltransferase [Thermodesulfobacteriota bacterium]
MDSDCQFRGVTGIILAGGKSRRYGKNKALAKVGGIPLIERVISVMKSVFHDLIVVTNTPEEYAYLGLPMYEDPIKGLGPLGGIFAGLEALANDAGFFVACDMPFLNKGLIRHMVEIRDDFDVVIPRMSWKLESLHALYRNRCLPAIKKLIDSREYQIFRFFPEVSVRYVDEDEIRGFDPELRSFLNVNRPRELRRLNDL